MRVGKAGARDAGRLRPSAEATAGAFAGTSHPGASVGARAPGHWDTGTQSLGAEAAGTKSTSAPELEVLSPISVITREAYSRCT